MNVLYCFQSLIVYIILKLKIDINIYFYFQKMKENDFSVSDEDSNSLESSESDDTEPEAPIFKSINEKTGGYLHLYCGPMASGKTSTLLTKLSQYSDLGWRAIYINHSKDVRMSGDSFFSSHNSQFLQLGKNVDGIKVDNLRQVDFKNYDIIAIDEFQFFSGNAVKHVLKWVNKYHKYVLLGFLDADRHRKKFGYGLDLIPHADKYEKLTAFCQHCIKYHKLMVPAPFTGCINSESKEQILIGSIDVYQPLCRYHHNLLMKNLMTI